MKKTKDVDLYLAYADRLIKATTTKMTIAKIILGVDEILKEKQSESRVAALKN